MRSHTLEMSEQVRFVRDIPVRPRVEKERRTGARACAIAGCNGTGEFRAPASKRRLDQYNWLCLDHVREFNRTWDFFQGMTPAEVESYIRDNVTGHRPTWSMGLRSSAAARTYAARMRFAAEFSDPFWVIHDGPNQGSAGAETRPRMPHRTRLQLEALTTLDLDETATLNEVKSRYKELVKRYHPDANGGDRSNEDRLKRVIRAYRMLRASNYA